MKLNFLLNVFHKRFIKEGKEIICEISANDLLKEYVSEVTFNEDVNKKWDNDKKRQDRFNYSKSVLRELTDSGYFTMDEGICVPTQKLWNNDEFYDFHHPEKYWQLSKHQKQTA